MAHCPHCSAAVPASARFCPGCGAAAVPDPTAAYVPPPAPDADSRFAAGQVLAGRYRVVAALGRGGMGEVYRADDLTLGQPVALKFLPAHLADDPDRLARFRKEVAVARRVSHPHACRVYDIAEHAGQSFLTMEFVDGEDLASLLKRVGRLPEEKGVEIARQLCAALGAVHDQGLLHRDLKPANVMLDGRGRVRLTDFGLTAAAADLSATEVRSGTPLYMAPEQQAGQEVTARSDVYALGLVLYEVFTGRRAFANKDRDDPPSKPSSHVTGLDPAVERVILKCLEANPADRPKSAAEVAAGLPGGDPLAAAVAAGETPSPRLVADAPVEGTLRPAVAGAMFAGVVVVLLVIAGLNDRYKAHRHVPLPPPAVLEEKARTLVRDLGYTDPPADSAGSFEMPVEHRLYMRRHGGQPAVTLDQMPLCRPPLAVYWHRQSPLPLVPARLGVLTRQDRLASSNPPADEPGMVTVKIDTRGRLVEFLAVPDSAAPPPTPVGWDALLKAAELDSPGALRPDPAAAPTPPVFADRTAAWDGTYPDRPDQAIRVEAASYRGRPVYFRITHPDWGEPPLDRPSLDRSVSPGTDYAVVFVIVFGVLMAALLVVAVRNVRRGRADLRGAMILAVTMIALIMLFELLVGTHFSGLVQVFPQFFHALEVVPLAVGLVTAGYLALEPVMRRRSPHRLTAWTRLTDGRWRDPLVGRDVLIGVLLGVAFSLDLPALPFYPSHLGPMVVNPDSFTRPVGELADFAAAAISIVLFWAGTFAVALTVARREWIAFTVLAVIILTLIVLGSDRPTLNVAFLCMRAVVVLFLLMRLGVLAAVACLFAVETPSVAPLTLDPSAWYFGASLTYFVALVGLAGYGAVVSLGGRSFFKGVFGDD